jgi:hypothetical protein
MAPQTLFARAGLVDDPAAESRRPGVEEAISLATELTTEQKQALVAVYRSLASANSP